MKINNNLLEQKNKSIEKIVVAFFASSTYGTEYRSGWELIRYAEKNGFQGAVISDIEKNESQQSLKLLIPHMNCIVVPSSIQRKNLLHKFTDFIPQLIWHYRVAKIIGSQFPEVKFIWIANGAQPWFPLSPYLRKTKAKIIWGPFGGGEQCPKKYQKKLTFSDFLREIFRENLQKFFTYRKARLIKKEPTDRIIPIARTGAARANLEQYLSLVTSIPVVPEILHPLKNKTYKFENVRNPKFIWVGQYVARKNLELSISIFLHLKNKYFPDAILNIYGPPANASADLDGVVFHGWVSAINWSEFTGNGILLCTSYREGLPSVLLEGLDNGLLCISTAVGSIPELSCDQLMIIPMDDYPEISEDVYIKIFKKIDFFLKSRIVSIPEIDFRDRLDFIFEKVFK